LAWNFPTPYSTVMSAGDTWVALVDDNEDSRALVRYVLEERGYLIGEFSEGRDFLNHLKAQKPTIALIDLRLPDMDGFQIPSVVQAEYGIRIPLIAVSAQVMAGSRERALQAGFSDFIPKPINLTSLVSTVQKYLLDE